MANAASCSSGGRLLLGEEPGTETRMPMIPDSTLVGEPAQAQEAHTRIGPATFAFGLEDQERAAGEISDQIDEQGFAVMEILEEIGGKRRTSRAAAGKPASGDFHEGEFRSGKPDGQGRITYPDGSAYEGG